jgi:hypothetical protein
MKKFLILTFVAALPAEMYFVRNFFGADSIHHCEIALRSISIYIGINFVISLIGFFGLLLVNMTNSNERRIVDLSRLRVKPDCELNKEDVQVKKWFEFLMKMLAFGIFSLPAFAMLSSYLFDFGYCMR